MSNEKRAPGWLGFIGDEILSSYIGIIINHEIRIPRNQPGWLMESREPGFLDRGSSVFLYDP